MSSGDAEVTGYTLAEIAEHERTLEFSHFSNDDAWELGAAFVAEAQSRSLPVVVQIRRGDQLLFHAARPGTTPDNEWWIARKVAVVYRFLHSSLYIGQTCRDAGTTFEQRYGLSEHDFAPHGGGFPIIIKDVGVVGVVVVSGLPEVLDHKLAVDVVGAFLAR